jgi:type III secretion protein C
MASLRKLVICSANVWFRRTGRVFATALFAVGLLSGVPAAVAQGQPEWASRPYAYVVIDQDVRGVLQAFGRNLGLPIVISDKVRGRAPANLRAANAGAFLDKLTTNNTLTWFSDGNMLYVDNEDDLQIRNFESVGLSAEDLQASLDELGVSGKHLHVRNSFQGDGLMVSGPPAYMALVQQRIDQIGRPEAGPVVAREYGVRVFRGSADSELVKAKPKQ